jgi:hypothetical protein
MRQLTFLNFFFFKGSFVGLIEEDSTLSEPRVMIGQIQEFLEDSCQAKLLWYTETSKSGQFRFQYEPEPWLEDVITLYPVKMSPVKNRPGLFRLNTSLRSIHRALSPSD